MFTLYYSDDQRGHGTVSANGGTGDSTSGGGAGGRIAIHTKNANEYKGGLYAYGETGTTGGDRGGPGTVLIEDRMSGGLDSEYTYQSRLYLDGKDLLPPKPVIVDERNPRVVASNEDLDNGADLNFDHLMLNKRVWWRAYNRTMDFECFMLCNFHF